MCARTRLFLEEPWVLQTPRYSLFIGVAFATACRWQQRKASQQTWVPEQKPQTTAEGKKMNGKSPCHTGKRAVIEIKKWISSMKWKCVNMDRVKPLLKQMLSQATKLNIVQVKSKWGKIWLCSRIWTGLSNFPLYQILLCKSFSWSLSTFQKGSLVCLFLCVGYHDFNTTLLFKMWGHSLIKTQDPRCHEADLPVEGDTKQINTNMKISQCAKGLTVTALWAHVTMCPSLGKQFGDLLI